METIKCKSCGAVQEVSNDASSCNFCGSAIELQQSKDFYKENISGETGNLMAMADTAVEATNWEEALQYYNKVLEKDITNSDAWLGKGIAIVYTSKIGNIKTKEAIAYWKNTIKHAENSDAMSKRVAKEINKVVNSFYPAIENHYIEFNELDNSYRELVSRFDTLENALDYATQLDINEIKYSETGYELCKRVIKLPQSYASNSKSAAQLSGTLGQFTSNKYSAAQARRDSMDKISVANRRLEEIAKASILVDGIQKKYVQAIQAINPNHYSVNELKEFEEVKAKEVLKKVRDEKQLKYFFAICIGSLIGVIIATQIGLQLNKNGIMLGSLKNIWSIGWATLGGYLGYAILNRFNSKSSK